VDSLRLWLLTGVKLALAGRGQSPRRDEPEAIYTGEWKGYLTI